MLSVSGQILVHRRCGSCILTLTDRHMPVAEKKIPNEIPSIFQSEMLHLITYITCFELAVMVRRGKVP